jgi:glycine/serine hydroxymethyltransferase
MREGEMRRIAELIDAVLAAPQDEAVATRVKAGVRELTDAFPLYV